MLASCNRVIDTSADKRKTKTGVYEGGTGWTLSVMLASCNRVIDTSADKRKTCDMKSKASLPILNPKKHRWNLIKAAS
jgi:hypothetical protein